MSKFYRASYFALLIGTAALCQWEVVAIIARHENVPSLSRICGDHRWIAPVILGGLTIHLYWRELGGKPVEEW